MSIKITNRVFFLSYLLLVMGCCGMTNLALDIEYLPIYTMSLDIGYLPELPQPDGMYIPSAYVARRNVHFPSAYEKLRKVFDNITCPYSPSSYF